MDRRSLALALAVAGVLTALMDMPPGPTNAQTVRSSRRGTVVRGEERTAAVGPRGVAVEGDEGYAAVGRRGAVAAGEDGAAAVSRRGAVVAGEEGAAAVGRHGAVVAGEEGVAAVGRGGVVVGNHYEDYEAWRAVAAVGTAIAIGTMLARPPAAAVTMAVAGSTYWYHDNVYYTRVMSGGNVVYQVVAPPAGAIIRTLPAGCAAARVGAVTYQRCGGVYYQRVATGYQVAVIR